MFSSYFLYYKSNYEPCIIMLDCGLTCKLISLDYAYGFLHGQDNLAAKTKPRHFLWLSLSSLSLLNVFPFAEKLVHVIVAMLCPDN